ncbi:MAG: hypothetical protein IPF92_02495 [Myxococcales bacterium]|jgi:hypothetical protein|nr:hypothetical protein [Myxococcales bacterium]MBL0197338.1 hypothetical protein [Myxococcales bacterium]
MMPLPEVTLVWLDGGGQVESRARPDAAQARALEAWATARGVRLVGLAQETRAPLPYSAPVVASIETSLTRGQDAIASLDGATADEALGAAETALAAHAELPQAPFLLAEVLRARALRATRLAPPNEAAARAALAEARGLDGGRVPGLGDPPEAPGPTAATVAIDLVARLAADDALLLDGRPLRPGPTNLEVSPEGANGGRWRARAEGEVARMNVTPGRHQLALVSSGALVWARWLTASEGLRVAVPVVRTACAPRDLAETRIQSGLAHPPPGALCGRWATARAAGPDVELATCTGSVCAPLVAWRVRAPEAPLAPRYVDQGFPTWAKWTTASAVTAILAGVVLVASGAFEAAPRTTRFTYGGLVER